MADGPARWIVHARAVRGAGEFYGAAPFSHLAGRPNSPKLVLHRTSNPFPVGLESTKRHRSRPNRQMARDLLTGVWKCAAMSAGMASRDGSDVCCCNHGMIGAGLVTD